MNETLPVILDTYNSKAINRFLLNIEVRKCIYYASDFLNCSEDDIADMQRSVQRTIDIFNTLGISVKEHFHTIYRCTQKSIYKDWKLSELACIYLLFDGNPDDLNLIARQQTYVIDQMLHFMHHQQHLQASL